MAAKDSKPQRAICPECGCVLPGGPGSMCPPCLLRGGMTLPEEETEAFRTEEVSLGGSPPKEKPPKSSDTPQEEWIGDRYHLLEKLGEGGFGLVWRAEQLKPIHRFVAIKILKAGMDTRQVIARFDAERQVLALMEHPNIARVLDAGETDAGRSFFVMELVKGEPITKFAQRTGMSIRDRLKLFLEVCSGVHHAHQKGIIHRDLKPSNVMVTNESGSPEAKIIDFGISKAMQGPLTDHTVYTGFDQLVGTPGYISPEQISQGSEATDTRTDVYALGSILFELLSGKPIVSPSELTQKPMHELLRDLLDRTIPPPSNRNPEVKGDLDWIVLKALEQEPERRYSSADALAEDIRCYLQDLPVTARPPSSGYLLKKFARRHRVGVAAASMVLAAVVLGGVTSTLLYFRAEAARQETSQGREAMRRAYSLADTQMGRQLTERGRELEALQSYCRALRTDPENDLAATNLLSLIQNVHLLKPVTQDLALPAGVERARLLAVSRHLERVLAVSAGVAAGDGDLLSLWDVGTQQRVDVGLESGEEVVTMQLDSMEHYVYLGLDSGRVLAWDLSRSMAESKMEGGGLPPTVQELMPRLPGAVLSLTCSDEGREVAAGSESGVMHLWLGEDLSRPAEVIREAHPVTALDLSERGRLLAAANLNGLATVREVGASGGLERPMATSSGLGHVRVSDNRSLLAMGFNHGGVRLLHAQTGQQLMPELSHSAAVTSLSLSASGTQLVVGDAGGWLHVWDARTGQLKFPASQLDGEVIETSQGSDEGIVASVSIHGEVDVWNPITNRRNLHRVGRSLAAVGLSADCSWLALSPDSGGVVQVWNIHERMVTRRYIGGPREDLAEIRSLPEPLPRSLRGVQVFGWSRGGDFLAAGFSGGVVRVFDAKTWKQVGADMNHAPAVGAVVVSQDGSRAFSSGRDRTVRGWSVANGMSSGLALSHNSFVPAMALTEGESRIVTVTDPGEIRVWDSVTGDGLTPGVLEGEGIERLVIPDGKPVLWFLAAGKGWFELPLPPQGAAPLPSWFIDWADTLGEKTEAELRRSGRDALSQMSASDGVGGEMARLWMIWLGADPESRTLEPAGSLAYESYLEQLLEDGSSAAVAEYQRCRPEERTQRER